MKNEWDCLVVGCGFAGAVIAREHAERGGKRVLIVDKRSHIGGNAYDSYNKDGILIHNYGPHIFHTQSSRVFDYLSRFTKWRNYSHEVLADIYGKRIPVPLTLILSTCLLSMPKQCWSKAHIGLWMGKTSNNIRAERTDRQ